MPLSRRSDNGLPSTVALNDSLELQLLLTSENSMQGENYKHSWTGTCPCTSSTWRSFGLAQGMVAWGAVSQRSGVIRDSTPLLRCRGWGGGLSAGEGRCGLR